MVDSFLATAEGRSTSPRQAFFVLNALLTMCSVPEPLRPSRHTKDRSSHYKKLGDHLGAANFSNATTWVDCPIHVLPAPGSVSARTHTKGNLLSPQMLVHVGNQPCNGPYLGYRYHPPLLRQGTLGWTACSAWVRVLFIRSTIPLFHLRVYFEVSADATGIKECGEERLYRCAYGKSLVGW
ncbi:unnamed protein product, partial [Ectocarpus sp. 13 AM-2016]